MLPLWKCLLCHLFWIISYPHSYPFPEVQVTQKAGVAGKPHSAPWSDSWSRGGLGQYVRLFTVRKGGVWREVVFKTWHWWYKPTSWTIPLVFHLPSCSRVQGCQLLSQWLILNGNTCTVQHSSFPLLTRLQWPNQLGTFFYPLLMYQWEPGVYLLRGFLKHDPFRPCEDARWDGRKTKVALEAPGAGLKSWHSGVWKGLRGQSGWGEAVKVCGLSWKEWEYNSISAVDWPWTACACIIACKMA